MTDPTERSRRILVELRVPVDRSNLFFAQLHAVLDVPTCRVDRNFQPVPSGPTSADSGARATDEEYVVIRVTIDADRVTDLENHPDVVQIWPDAPIEPFSNGMTQRDFTVELVANDARGPCAIPPCDCDPLTPRGTIGDVAQYLGMPEIWREGYRGQGVIVGIVDGGIAAIGRSSAGVIPQVIGGWPDAEWGTGAAAWGGHGNMTATDALGMAPDAGLFDIRIASGDTQGTISAALSGFQWAIERHRATGQPQVLSNSWGIYQESWDTAYANDPDHIFTRKVREAIGAGIVVLFAAGNCGESCPSSRCGSDTGPGRSIWGANGHSEVLTVGAANTDGELIGYSSQGPAALSSGKPDFLSLSHFRGYFPVDTGTSAACPVAAGVVSTLLGAFPGTTSNEIKRVLQETALDIGNTGWDQHSGSGIINAAAAYHELMLEFLSPAVTAIDATCP
jgi:serine protease AprX